MDNTTTITIDLAKDIFQVVVFSKYGKALINSVVFSADRETASVAAHFFVGGSSAGKLP